MRPKICTLGLCAGIFRLMGVSLLEIEPNSERNGDAESGVEILNGTYYDFNLGKSQKKLKIKNEFLMGHKGIKSNSLQSNR